MLEFLKRHGELGILLLGELIAGIAIINYRGYTEIDWKAYMQEVEGFLKGDWNYYNLKGDTGPLVYPAGFVYIYSLLYYVCDYGKNILLAQYIFLGIYLVNLYTVLSIYKKIKRSTGPLAMILCCLSYRVHSIFLLRLFNDPIAMTFMHVCVKRCSENRWSAAILWFNLALSVKMNILLYLPGLLLLINWSMNYRKTIVSVVYTVVFQAAIATPFLYQNYSAYLNRAFDFGRQFEMKWSVNWQFLPLQVFESRLFHLSLLCLHLTLLLGFLFLKASYGNTFKGRIKSLNLPVSLEELKNPSQKIRSIDPLSKN